MQFEGMQLDYQIIGCPRCGTTTMHAYLAQHSDVSVPLHPKHKYPGKEVHLFDHFYNEESWRFAFSSYKPGTLIGDATPTYFHQPQFGSRIVDHNPNIKLIVLLRHPVRGVYSHFWLAREDKNPNLFPKYVEKNLTTHWLFQVYRYFEYLEYWAQTFDCLFLKSEDFYTNTQEVIEKVYSFLGLRIPFFKAKHKHKMNYPPLDEETYRTVADFYRESATQTCEYLKWEPWEI